MAEQRAGRYYSILQTFTQQIYKGGNIFQGAYISIRTSLNRLYVCL